MVTVEWGGVDWMGLVRLGMFWGGSFLCPGVFMEEIILEPSESKSNFEQLCNALHLLVQCDTEKYGRNLIDITLKIIEIRR